MDSSTFGDISGGACLQTLYHEINKALVEITMPEESYGGRVGRA